MRDEVVLKLDLDVLIKEYIKNKYPALVDGDGNIQFAMEYDAFYNANEEHIFDPVVLELFNGIARVGSHPSKIEDGVKLEHHFVEAETISVVVSVMAPLEKK